GPFDGTGAWTMTVPETPPGSSSIKVIFKADASMAYVFETQIREGYLQIGGTGVKFALMGRRGVYDDPYSRVYVDADGDGEIRSGDLGAAGAFEVSESYLFIDDRR
ncbi:MAG: hypothetical protein GTO30_11505, partial [Acidobacteria bacterium]|nr:hypothetical protein [Acidobacteriota bacterium]NIQ87014.1 hypothetical protein [Acidobacteriota bacterium]